MDKRDEVELLNAKREFARARVEQIIQLRANTTDSMRLYHVAMPYFVGVFVGSLYVVVAVANNEARSGFWFVFVGMALPIGLMVIFLCVLLVIEIANEWELARIFRDKISADIPETNTEVLPDFPPRWFVEFMRDYHGKTGRLPGVDTVNTHRRAQDNTFNRGVAEQYYTALVEWGAVTGREPHGKSAGKPAWAWEQMLERST